LYYFYAMTLIMVFSVFFWYFKPIWLNC